MVDVKEAAAPRRVAVVIPVYCEKDTVADVVREIFAQPLTDEIEVWVVDDSSPDGTAASIEALRSEFAGLNLMVRPVPDGRGAAVMDAFTRLIGRDDPPDLIVEMDGDGSHEPVSLGPLLDATVGADVVIGSRYIDGGDADLTPRRRMLSRLANGFAGLVLRLPYADCSSGYRCYRREALETVDITSINCGGHATHLELLFGLHRAGARVVEVPIHYRSRRAGETKVTLKETLRVAMVLLAMRLSAGALPRAAIASPQGSANSKRRR